MLSTYNIYQSSSFSLNENNVQCDQPSFVSEKIDHCSSINNQMDLPSEQHQTQTPVEPSNTNGSNDKNLSNEKQDHVNDQESINSLSINQHLTTQSLLTNDKQTINTNPLNPEEIQEPQISATTTAVNFQVDNHSHYTTYFYKQSDFKDYTNSSVVARVPKLFTGKRFIS
jgi:hypothetical protein